MYSEFLMWYSSSLLPSSVSLPWKGFLSGTGNQPCGVRNEVLITQARELP